MTDTSDVIGGVDCNAETHHAAVIDHRGRLLATSEFPTTAEGYRQLTTWLHQHGGIEKGGVECSGFYGAGLTPYLKASGITVVGVNRPHIHTQSRRGKTYAIDAEALARKVLAGECTTAPKTPPASWNLSGSCS